MKVRGMPELPESLEALGWDVKICTDDIGRPYRVYLMPERVRVACYRAAENHQRIGHRFRERMRRDA